jgi:hypothetical protein
VSIVGISAQKAVTRGDAIGKTVVIDAIDYSSRVVTLPGGTLS